MIYKYTADNIYTLMQQAGTLERQQIVRFFSDVTPEDQLDRLLYRFTVDRFLHYDEATDRFTYHAAPELDEVYIRRRISAFWPIANFRSQSCRLITSMSYPFSFFLVDNDNFCYDFTWCSSVNVATACRKLWSISYSKDVPDDINHIAVVADKSFGESLRGWGFDSFCTIDPVTHGTSYVML